MAGYKMHAFIVLVVALCASAAIPTSKPEIAGLNKLSYSIVTSQSIVPGSEFVVHLNLFNVVNTTLTPTKPKPTGPVRYGDEFPSNDHSINLNVTIHGLISYYHNLKLVVGKEPKCFSEVLRFVVPETSLLKDLPLSSRTDFLSDLRNRTVTITTTNTLHISHSAKLPVVPRKIHPMLISDKMSYMKGEKVKLAVLVHYSDMKPYKGAFNISLTDPKGVESMSLRFDRSPNGIIVRDIPIEKIFPSGLYNLSISVQGETVTKVILISEQVKKNFKVKVAVPSHIAVSLKDESKSSDIKIAVHAYYPNGMPVKGMVEPRIMLRNSSLPLTLTLLKPLPLKEGVSYWSLPLSEVRKSLKVPVGVKLVNTVLDLQLRVIEEREEWHLESQSSSGTPTAIPSGITTPSGIKTESTTLSPKFYPETRRKSQSEDSTTTPTFGKLPSHNDHLYLIDSSRIVEVNTSIILTDQPLSLEFPDFTPSTFKRQQKFIGYINLRALDEVSHSYQYMSLKKDEMERLEKGEDLKYLQQIKKSFPYIPLTIDYLQRRTVEIKIRHFATLPITLPHNSSEKPLKEETIMLSVLPSIVSSFEFRGLKEASKVEIEATYKDTDTDKVVKVFKRDIIAFQTHSKTSNTIQISLNQRRPNVTLGESLKTSISCSFGIKNLFYGIYNDQSLVMAGHKSWEKETKIQNLEVFLNQSLARLLPPVARILVWTSTPEQEIVADSLFFIVKNNHVNRTRLEVSSRVLSKNRNLTTILYAPAHSDVLIMSSYEAMMPSADAKTHSSFEAMLLNINKGSMNMLAKKLRFSLLHSDHSRTPLLRSLSLPSLYTSSCLRPFQTLPGSSCLYSALMSPTTLLLNNYTTLPSLHHDSYTLFNESRSMIFTDGIVYKSPLTPLPMRKSSEVRHGLKYSSMLKDRSTNEQLETYMRNIQQLPMQDSTPPQLSYFRIHRVPESGMINFTMVLPALRRLYTIQAISIHSEHGVQMLPEPVQVSVKPPVITYLRNPSVVVEGEEFALKVNIYNSESKPISVEVVVKEERDFRVVCKNVKMPAKTPSRSDETSKGEYKTTTLKIQPGETLEYRMYIQTLKRSDRFEKSIIQVPVVVIYDKSPIITTTSFTILPMGYTSEINWGRMVELGPSGKNFEMTMPRSSLPSTLPKENTRTTVRIYRDVLAPAIENMCKNLMNQTSENELEMMNFQIALHGVKHVLNSMLNDTAIEGNKWERIMNRLKKSVDIEASVEQQHINFQRVVCLKKVVERYQSLLKKDNKLTKNTPESISVGLIKLEGIVEWWKVADVNSTLATRSINWLLSKQKPTGCFEEEKNTPIFYPEWAPNNESMNVPLTSQVVIILTKCKKSLPLEKMLIEKINKCLMKACSFLESKIKTPVVSRNSLSMSMATYALVLCNSPKLFQAIAIRDALKTIKGGEVFWMQGGKDSPASHVSLSIQATSYAVLTHLRMGDLNSTTPMCNWLLSHMKSNGRFVNSIDTSVALEALVVYSKLMSQKNKVGLSHVELTISTLEKSFIFSTTQSTIDVTTIIRQELKSVRGNCKISMQGRGLVVLHEITELKETKAKNMEKSESVILKVSNTKKSDLFDSLNICLKLTKPNRGEIVMVKVPVLSGHIFNWKKNLATLAKLGLERQPVVNNTISLSTYMLSDSKETCFELLLEVSQRIGNIQPRIITASTFAELGSPSMVSYSESHKIHEHETICATCVCLTRLTPKRFGIKVQLKITF